MNAPTNPPTTPARIKVQTVVPAGTDLKAAKRAALVAAAEQLGIHIVEESLLPLMEKIPNEAKKAKFNEMAAAGAAPSPEALEAYNALPDLVDNANDATVDRLLTTWWSLT